MPASRTRSTCALSNLALAIACALPGAATAANYTASTDAQLIADINAANASPDASSTITLSGNITLTASDLPLPSPSKPLTIDTGSFSVTGPQATTGISSIQFPGTGATLTLYGTLQGGNGNASDTNAGAALQVNTATASVVNYGHLNGGSGFTSGGISGTPGFGLEMGAGTFVNDGSITGGNTDSSVIASAAAVLSQKGTLTNAGTITGGNSATGTGGAGMQILAQGGTLNNSGTITGGQSLSSSVAGGVGISISGVGTTVINNTGTIAGGKDAQAISVNMLTTDIVNSGTIKAGAGQANAIQVGAVGRNFTLELDPGSTIIGNVMAYAQGITQTLVLGGSGSDTFDVSLIGPTAQYQNFKTFQKTGSSTWALTGTGTVSTPWVIQQGTLQVGNGGTSGSFIGNVTDNGTLAFDRSDVSTFANLISGSGNVSQMGTGTTVLTGANTYTGGTALVAGTLSIGSDGNLGDTAGSISFNGGTLENTADISSNRSVTFNTTGTLLTDAGTTLTLGGTLAGSGVLTKSGAGTLLLTADASYTGGTIINAGTLQLGNGGTSGSVVGNITDNAALVFNRSDDVTFDGVISGNGTLTKLGTDTLTLTGNSTFNGSTVISGGTLQLGSGGTSGTLAGSVANSGTLAFDRSDAAIFAGTVFGSGNVAQIGSGTTILTSANTYTGGTTISAGTLQLGNGGTSGSIVGDVTDNGTLAFDHSDNVSFGNIVSGNGGVVQLGSGITTLSGNNTYTGATDVTTGTLAVTGSIASSAVTVHSGAILTGTGTVGATTVQTGGTMAPAGLGTLTVNGNYTQASGATYQVNVNPTSDASGSISVNGMATLANGANIVVIKTPDVPYVVGDKYTVLTSTGGLSGTFNLSGQTAVSALLALQSSYDAKNAYLTVMQTGSIGTVATTPNQAATGGGLESTGTTAPATTAVLNSSTDDAARVALDKLSGEVFASAQTALQEDSEYSRNAATDRMRNAFCAVGATATTPNGSAAAVSDCTGDGNHTAGWARLFGSWGYNNGNGNAAKLDHSTGGLFIGVDTPVSDWRVGALAGYGRSGFDVNARNSSGSSDDYYLGMYGGTQWGALGLRTGATYTWHDLSSNRLLNLPGLPGSVGANYHAGTAQVFGDLGYRIDAGAASYEPFANLAYTQLHTNGFTEEGGAAALTSRSEQMDTTFSTLGMRASTAFKVDGAAAAVHASLGWRHAFGDVTPQTDVAFAGGNDFGISGVAIARNSAVVDFGLDVHLASNATFGIAYFGEYGSGALDQGVRGTVHLTF